MSDYDRYNSNSMSARFNEMSLSGSRVFDYNHNDQDDCNRSLSSVATSAYLRMKADLEASDAEEAARKSQEAQDNKKYHISQRKLLQGVRRSSQTSINPYQGRSMSPGVRAPYSSGGGGGDGSSSYGSSRNDYRTARSMSPTPPGHIAARGGGGYNPHNNYGDSNRGNSNNSNYGGARENNYAATRAYQQQQQQQQAPPPQRGRNNNAMTRTPSSRSLSPNRNVTRPNRRLPNKSISFQRDGQTGTYHPNTSDHTTNINSTAHAHYSPPMPREGSEDGRKPAASYNRTNNINPHRYREDINSSAHSPYVPPSQRRQPPPPPPPPPRQQSPNSSTATPNSLSIMRRSQRSSVHSVVSDISECRSVYGDGMPVWGNHVDKAEDVGVAPSKEQQPAMMIEIQPGFSLPLRGADETTRALAVNFIVKLNCMVCTLEIQCIGDAEYILCPVCRSVSPIEGNSGNNGGVGLGLQVGG